MNRLDRALAILLLLRDGATLAAADLAQRFEVSQRTIYRDIDVLAASGVPVYAEMGRKGGFRLSEGYFLPPVMFSEGEATSLIVGLTLLNRLRATPFQAERDMARQKLLAIIPDQLEDTLKRMEQQIVFEALPFDTFHTEVPHSPLEQAAHPVVRGEETIITTFIRALIGRKRVQFEYQAPTSTVAKTYQVYPCGILWDRDFWYLVGYRVGFTDPEPRFWRADRVLTISAHGPLDASPDEQIGHWLGRRWLHGAMRQWQHENPVVLRISQAQAQRCQADWYYQHAEYTNLADGTVQMAFGEDTRAVVFALIRWLGPGAELLEPNRWRSELQAELKAMAEAY
jgi:predicted DNA-binding transcriptional regulator YafY